jgi:pyrroloquinoline quinone biosynthesis protein B
LAWAGDARVQPRTQASLAVTADGESWLLINASPDLPQQIRQSRALHPRNGTRGSPIKAVLLTGAEIDQVAGLLSLREREPFRLYAISKATIRRPPARRQQMSASSFAPARRASSMSPALPP